MSLAASCGASTLRASTVCRLRQLGRSRLRLRFQSCWGAATAGTTSRTWGLLKMLHCIFNYEVPSPYELVATDIGDDIVHLVFYLFALRGQV